MSTVPPPPQAGRREWIGLGVIALPCVLYSMDLTVLNLAVPSLSADLKPSSTQLLWIIDIYGFLVAGSLITMGTLGDRIGRRRLLLIGAAAFAVASALAAFSTSAGMLIATRAVLGLAGATLAPSTLSLIRNMFLDPRQRAVAVGVWISSYSAGAVIGPPLGGFITTYFSWHWIFLINVPIGLIGIVLVTRFIENIRAEAHETANHKVFHLADLFNNVPLQLARVERGQLTHKQVLDWIKSRAKEKGMSSWINSAGKRSVNATKPTLSATAVSRKSA